MATTPIPTPTPTPPMIRLHPSMRPAYTIKEALDLLGQYPWSGMTNVGPEYSNFCDKVTEYIFTGTRDAFYMPRSVERIAFISVYSVDGKRVELSDVSRNFLTRALFALTTLPFIPFALFATLRLSGVDIPHQTMCCAAGLRECFDNPPGYMNMSRNRFSWFKLLLGMGFPILETSGELIKDDQRNSIADVVADWNVINLLRELVRQGVTHIKVLPSTEGRFQALSLKSNSVRKNLAKITIEKLETIEIKNN